MSDCQGDCGEDTCVTPGCGEGKCSTCGKFEDDCCCYDDGFPDYCVNGKHVAFPPERVCYCGAVYFMRPLSITQ